MRKIQYFVAVLAATCTCSFIFAQESQKKDQNLEFSQEDIIKISEAFGHYIGRNLNTPAVKFDAEMVIQGIREGMKGDPAPMTEKEYEEKMLKLQKFAFSKMADQNLKAANEFLAKNAKERAVVEIEPGKLQYQILQNGTGDSVEPNSSPLINYSGKLLDGTVFGSTEETGSPITIPLDQTVPGFSKGIVGMKEGEKRRLFLHPDVAYGKSGQLPPNSLLIFDIEVVKAKSPRIAEADEEDLLPLPADEEDLDDEDEDEDEVPKKTPEKVKVSASSKS